MNQSMITGFALGLITTAALIFGGYFFYQYQMLSRMDSWSYFTSQPEYFVSIDGAVGTGLPSSLVEQFFDDARSVPTIIRVQHFPRPPRKGGADEERPTRMTVEFEQAVENVAVLGVDSTRLELEQNGSRLTLELSSDAPQPEIKLLIRTTRALLNAPRFTFSPAEAFQLNGPAGFGMNAVLVRES